MVRGKRDPERLLEVVVRVVVAVPGGADPAVAPVREQPGTVDARADSAIEEVEVAIPGPFERFVAELDTGPTPESRHESRASADATSNAALVGSGRTTSAGTSRSRPSCKAHDCDEWSGCRNAGAIDPAIRKPTPRALSVSRASPSAGSTCRKRQAIAGCA